MIKTNNQTAVKTHRKFDQTFKREAVNNWLTSGKSANVVALELGILPNRLYAWRKAVAPAAALPPASAGATAATPAEVLAELIAARREIRHLTEQRDILKKTLGILSEPSPNALNGFTR